MGTACCASENKTQQNLLASSNSNGAISPLGIAKVKIDGKATAGDVSSRNSERDLVPLHMLSKTHKLEDSPTP